MDAASPCKKLLRCLTLLLLVAGTLVPAADPVKQENDLVFEEIVDRIKRGAHYFTECTIDQLSTFCTLDTALNFECFRTIGKCIPGVLRKALMKEDDDDQEDEDTVSQASDEL
ncbi:uncharacterized protein BXIN_1066 [Babesia sp. Xinjiang]|uniref:uncharacterized protein n=1 Tax=Babesia sp. Xinjiang TaxID=462227 RepID=UPI000A22FA89|nr:uncharacterized protein BXIN_1066 [Babesia sp. Xinjiang]ORM41983.1 hypothetical protein BXIN_1066 [Babesia sp. Xinjiang]